MSTSPRARLVAILFVLGAALGPEGQASAQTGPLSDEAQLVPSDGTGNDAYGTAAGISGTTAAVGSPGHGNGTGAAYVFVRSGNAWLQQQELSASNGVANAHLGETLGVNGDTIIVGAPGQPVGVLFGAAYVFVRNSSTWSQQQELTDSSPITGDAFASAVAIDGDTAIVGCSPLSAGSGSNRAFVFVRNANSWSLQQILTAPDSAAGDQFGSAVAVSQSTVVVGAGFKTSQTGAAYVFVRSGTTWSLQQELQASDAMPGTQFGTAVSISGDTLVVGAWRLTEAAYVFVRNGTTWSQQQRLVDADPVKGTQFGRSVALSGDLAAVGAPTATIDQTGLGFLFSRTGTTWSQQQVFTCSGGRCGSAVGIDGTTAVVGAPSAAPLGAAYAFAQPSAAVPALGHRATSILSAFWFAAALLGIKIREGYRSRRSHPRDPHR